MIKRGIYKQLAEIGKVKIGMKGEEKTSKNGKKFRVPMKLDHFIVTTTERDNNGDYVVNNEIMDKLPPQPKELNIMFLFDDIDLNFHTEYAYYHGNQRLCHGDGVAAMRTYLRDSKAEPVLDDEAVNMYENGEHDKLYLLRYKKEVKEPVKAGDSRLIVCDPEKCPFAQPDDKGATKCKPSGIMSFILQESMEIGGVYRFRTHSWHAVSSILSSLELISSMTGGTLAGLPMKMKLLKRATQDHGNVYYVTVVFDGEAHKMREAAAIEQQQRKMIGVNVSDIEEAARSVQFTEVEDDDVEEEFYADTVSEEEKDITDRAASVLGGVSTDIPESVPETENEEVEEEEKEDDDIEQNLF